MSDVMAWENKLPEDFDGTFKFTNWSDEEFVGKWNNKEYVYPPMATSPMIIPDESPLQIQHIRKKFAKDLAEREFFKSEKYRSFQAQERSPEGVAKLNSIHQAATYNLSDLEQGIQMALVPLEIKKAVIRPADKSENFARVEETLTRNEEGQLNTMPLDKNTSLRARALEGKGLAG